MPGLAFSLALRASPQVSFKEVCKQLRYGIKSKPNMLGVRRVEGEEDDEAFPCRTQ